jgi:hypothetical protein
MIWRHLCIHNQKENEEELLLFTETLVLFSRIETHRALTMYCNMIIKRNTSPIRWILIVTCIVNCNEMKYKVTDQEGGNENSFLLQMIHHIKWSTSCMEEKAATYSSSVNSSYDCENLFDDNGIPFTFGTYTSELFRQKNGKGHAIPPHMLARLKLLRLLKREDCFKFCFP